MGKWIGGCFLLGGLLIVAGCSKPNNGTGTGGAPAANHGTQTGTQGNTPLGNGAVGANHGVTGANHGAAASGAANGQQPGAETQSSGAGHEGGVGPTGTAPRAVEVPPAPGTGAPTGRVPQGVNVPGQGNSGGNTGAPAGTNSGAVPNHVNVPPVGNEGPSAGGAPRDVHVPPAQEGAALGEKAPGDLNVGGASGGTSGAGPALSPEAFATQAFQIDLAEVRLGKLAEEKAANADVKKFGQRMVHDHGQANEQLQSLAQKQHLELPTGQSLPQSQQQLVERLSNQTGAQFDRTYIESMIPDHRKAIQMFEAEAKEGKDPALKEWAAHMVPILQTHLRLAEQAARAIGPSGGATANQ